MRICAEFPEFYAPLWKNTELLLHFFNTLIVFAKVLTISILRDLLPAKPIGGNHVNC